MATFSCSWDVSGTSATLTARFRDGDDGFEGTRYIRWEVSGGGDTFSEIEAESTSGGSTSFSVSLNGLAPGTTYYYYVELGYMADGESSITWCAQYGYDDEGTFETDPEYIRPDDFSWTYVKRSGGAFNLTAREWNRFTARINDFRAYCEYSDYDFSVAYSGDPFTATMFNEARSAIKSMVSVSVSEVYKGDIITADMLNDLVDDLNSIY